MGTKQPTPLPSQQKAKTSKKLSTKILSWSAVAVIGGPIFIFLSPVIIPMLLIFCLIWAIDYLLPDEISRVVFQPKHARYTPPPTTSKPTPPPPPPMKPETVYVKVVN